MSSTSSISMESDEHPASGMPTTAPASSTESIAVVGKPGFFAGHAFGFRQSTLRLVVRVSLAAHPSLSELNDLLVSQGREAVSPLDPDPEMAILSRLVGWVCALQELSLIHI